MNLAAIPTISSESTRRPKLQARMLGQTDESQECNATGNRVTGISVTGISVTGISVTGISVTDKRASRRPRVAAYCSPRSPGRKPDICN